MLAMWCGFFSVFGGWLSMTVCPKCQTPIQSNNTIAEPVEVVSPKTIEKWRRWGVPEQVIKSEIEWRETLRELRRKEEYVTVEGFAYLMPRLPEVERRSWGFAKAIDFEGSIAEITVGRDRIAKIDRWKYRWEYQLPYVAISGASYPLIREMAEMLLIATTPTYRLRAYVAKGKIVRKRSLQYVVRPQGRRAIRIIYLTEPYLRIPEKRLRARKILEKYRESPNIPILR